VSPGRAGVRTIGLRDGPAAARLSLMNTLLAVLTGGGIAAAGSLLTGWQSNRFGRRRDEATRAHEQQMAREAVAQERLDRAYTELGIFLSHWAAWARSVHPFMGQGAPPDPMPDEEQWRIETLVKNHGSPEVRALLDQWTEIARKIENANEVIELADHARGPAPELDKEAQKERLALEDYRKQLQEAANRIHDRMSAELSGQAALPQPS
jgi:hypothetical protein